MNRQWGAGMKAALRGGCRGISPITPLHTLEQKVVSPGNFDLLAGRGWGFGVAVVTEPDAFSAVPGRYGWDGGLGTSWLNDPHHGLVAMVMTQSADFLVTDAMPAFWTEVYRALAT